MREVAKVSDLTYTDLADYLRITELTADDENTLNNLLEIAKTYIMQWTGRTREQLDDYQDFIIVVLVLVQDMWDNRALYVDKSNLNHVVESILGLHQVNLL